MNNELTQQQIDGIEGMISRRIENAGETREQACAHILNYLQSRYEPQQRTAE